MKILKRDLLNILIFPDCQALGRAAAHNISATIKEVLCEKEIVNMVFGAAPSQNETLYFLCQDTTIDWSRVRAFHMDEYVGLPPGAPETFSEYLREHLFEKVPFYEVHFIDGHGKDTAKECARYAALLTQYPTDIVCLGIGENTHIAFNDPHSADFDEPDLVKVVDMDEPCRMQQVHDGCFPSLDAVPRQAITLTVPALFRAAHAFCMVPGNRKAQAVASVLHSPDITPRYPATILRRHADAYLFLDADSASLL